VRNGLKGKGVRGFLTDHGVKFSVKSVEVIERKALLAKALRCAQGKSAQTIEREGFGCSLREGS
jgi:hypothetical protein